MIHFDSIRAKLIAIVMITTCASLFLMGMALASYELISYRNAMTEEMATIGKIIGANSTAALTFNDEAAATEILAALKPQPEMRLACLYDVRGHLFSSFLKPGEPGSCPKSPSVDGVSFGGGVLVQSMAVMLGSQRIGTLRLVATLGDLWRRLQLFGGVLALVVTVSALAGLLLSSRLLNLVSRPILELATIARRISEQRDYALRAPQRSGDEVGVAVGAFNQMLDRIQDTDQALRKAGETSREQAQFLSSILDNMGEGMVVVDQSGKIRVWNAAATRILGPSPVDLDMSEWPRHFGLLGAANGTLIGADELPLVRALHDEVVTDQEIYLEATDNRPGLWVNATARPLSDAQGKVWGAISVFRDVTPQKHAELELRSSEEQLRQSQKMDAVGQLAGGIAHDFNNLLNVICGYSSLILDRASLDESVRKDIEEVLRAGERAATLTRQLLAFSRKQVMAPQPLDLNLVIQNSEKMLRRLIGENVELEVVYGADLGRVLADPGQVDQVVLNLVVNARDAMPNGGKVTIATANAELDERYAREHVGVRAGPFVRISVTDTGMGMSPEVQAHIFEPFFTTKAPGKGTGLGLSTVYGIIQQSGGHIAVSSVPEQGTTFHLYLPRTESRLSTVRPELAKRLPTSRGTETILLTEDEPAVRNLAREILAGLGYKVLVASDGVDALEVQANHPGPIHLLISDVVMPRMGGPELAKRLRERLPEIRVVFISGYTADAIVHPGLSGNELTLIQKPFTADMLACKAREILDR